MLKTAIIIIGVIIVMIIINKLKNVGIAQVNISEAQAMVKDTGVLLLDVRTPAEYAAGHIKGAKLIPVDELSGRLSEIGDRKDRKILVYCHAGNRSLSASRILNGNGYTGILNLQGGITSWMNAGGKVVGEEK
jgi:phage shock protein E